MVSRLVADRILIVNLTDKANIKIQSWNDVISARFLCFFTIHSLCHQKRDTYSYHSV